MINVTVTSPHGAVPANVLIKPDPAHVGGEGSVYFTADGQYAVKIYHRVSPEKRTLLQTVINLAGRLGEDDEFLAWPLAIVDTFGDRPSMGVVTRRVAPNYAPLYHYMYAPKDAVAQFRQGQSWLQYLKMARSVTAAVRTIHGRGMAHADIHLKNFLADPKTGRTVLIDLDGLVVKGFLPPQVLGMPGFIAPEVLKGLAKPSDSTDRYSTAVLVLWTLLLRDVMYPLTCEDEDDPDNDRRLGYGEFACFSEHPTDLRNRPPALGQPFYKGGALSYQMLTPKLQQLTKLTLIDHLHDPHNRPQVRAWEQALAEAYDTLVTCRHCLQTFIYPYWLKLREQRTCPFCGTPIQAPFPVVLNLLQPGPQGFYGPVRNVVLYHDYPLFADVIQPAKLPPFTRAEVPQIGKVIWDSSRNCHLLRNTSDMTWQVVRPINAQVKPNEAVQLRPGFIIQFGAGNRLLQVME